MKGGEGEEGCDEGSEVRMDKVAGSKEEEGYGV